MRSVITPQGHGLGWQPDLPDKRDFLVEPPNSATLKKIATTPVVDLSTSPFMPPIWNQGQLGSCTAHSTGANYMYAAWKSGNKVSTPSRLYIYYNERVIEGTVSTDSGAQIRDGFTVCSQGVPPETDWPYDISQFAVAPPQQADTDALQHKDTVYTSVPQDRENILAQLVSGFIVSFGFTVYESFESQEVASTGVVPMPAPGEQVLGGHAVVIVGYDNNAQQYKVRNSWGSADTDGTEWGINGSGYFVMPYQYVEDPNLASDFWIAEAAD